MDHLRMRLADHGLGSQRTDHGHRDHGRSLQITALPAPRRDSGAAAPTIQGHQRNTVAKQHISTAHSNTGSAAEAQSPDRHVTEHHSDSTVQRAAVRRSSAAQRHSGTAAQQLQQVCKQQRNSAAWQQCSNIVDPQNSEQTRKVLSGPAIMLRKNVASCDCGGFVFCCLESAASDLLSIISPSKEWQNTLVV
jgi:hypothetical protein